MESEIIILSDTHLGISSNWKLDDNNISYKTYDGLDKFYMILKMIVERKEKYDISLILIAGDFLDNLNIPPIIIIKLFQIFGYLESKNIGVIILGGNHDSSSNLKKKDQLNIFSLIKNCIIIREYAWINFKTATIKYIRKDIEDPEPKFNTWWKKTILPKIQDLGLGILPFLSLRAIKDYYFIPYKIDINKNTQINDEQNELEFYFSEEIIKKNIYENIKDCKHKILLGHYQLFNSKLHEGKNEKLLSRELHFSKKMIQPDFWDFVGFGHIHMPQAIWGTDSKDTLWKIQHIGAINKFHFDERDDHRRYLIYNYDTKKITEISLDYDINNKQEYQVRPMIQEEITIPLGTEFPNEYILNHIFSKYSKELLQDSNIKLIINIYLEDTTKLNKKDLRDVIEQHVFYIEFISLNIIRSTYTEDYSYIKERTTFDLPQLLSLFLTQCKNNKKITNDPEIYKKIETTSHEILIEAIRRNEEKNDQ